jgi:hypothetical protein
MRVKRFRSFPDEGRGLAGILDSLADVGSGHGRFYSVRTVPEFAAGKSVDDER